MTPQATSILVRALPEVVRTPVRSGFRIWQVRDGELHSPYQSDRWDQPVRRATCDRARPAGAPGSAWSADEHHPPHPGCRCGIHASARPNVAYSQINFRGVTGIVTVWGRLEREPDGVRAEYAKVAALGIYAHWTARQRDAVRRIAMQLEADVLDLYDLPAAASQYGPSLPAPDPGAISLGH